MHKITKIDLTHPMYFILIQHLQNVSIHKITILISFQEITKTALQTLGHFLILALISAIFMVIVWWITDFELLSILLAFSPGGQAEMNIIAIIVGANLPYVALHHVVRLFLVMAIAPMMLQFVMGKKRNQQ